MQERVQKIIASHGITSRRKAEELIVEGRVTVNGEVVSLGAKADPFKDHIKVDGKLLSGKETPLYFAFNKPVRVLTALSDPEGRVTLKDFLKKLRQTVYPVGRLDFNSEGLLILTNDGTLAHAVMHPSQKIPKRYHVKVRGIPEETKLGKLRKGIRLEDGLTMPAEIKRLGLSRKQKNTWLEVTIYEGKKRQIRRMFEYIKHPVTKLKRVAINGVSLGSLKPGEHRKLTDAEIRHLRRSVGIMFK